MSLAGPGATDLRFMDMALRLGERGLGRAWPNPAVGCVVVRDGAVVGRGWTQDGGRPHAETEALRRAGEAAKGATAYVTLEPCAHHGRTGPCAEALAAAGVARVVAAIEDPDPRVSGAGLDQLRREGVAVESGIRAAEAAEANAGFLKRVRSGLPLVTLKTATSLDGRIATHTGHSQWITGEAARARAHLLRARHDAIMVGGETALADDPELTCRLPGLEHASPVRVVADGRLRLPPDSRLARTARELPVWILTRGDTDPERARALERAGVEVFRFSLGPDGALDLESGLRRLAERGITRVLVEGGARLAGALLARRLVDRLCWFRAPILMGGDGVAALPPLGIDRMDDALRLPCISTEPVGEDVLETYAFDT